MLSIRKRAIALSTIGFMAMPFLLSCENRPLAFKKLFERNVVWSDEEGKISIAVQGEADCRGFAKLMINDKEVRATALFTDESTYTGISLETEEYTMGLSYDACYGLAFKEMVDSSKATFEFGSLSALGDPYFDSGNPVLLTKRPIREDELDARYCFVSRWVSDEINLRITSVKDTPYTGRMFVDYNDKELIFLFLEESGFRFMDGENVVAEGKYISSFDSMTLRFDVCGSEEFGESLCLSIPFVSI
ncbi:MAG: hypothetical protein K6G74_01770 [Bacilli bacterium]|nr:hypothetical protein [Bacilli bacterium]